MTTSLLHWCPKHGTGVEIMKIAGVPFCAQCVARHLAGYCEVVEMKETVSVSKEPTDMQCSSCSKQWNSRHGTACPACGERQV